MLQTSASRQQLTSYIRATTTRSHQIQIGRCHLIVDERLDLLRALAVPDSVSALGDGASAGAQQIPGAQAYALGHKSTRGRQRGQG